jgi:hypothetical protein
VPVERKSVDFRTCIFITLLHLRRARGSAFSKRQALNLDYRDPLERVFRMSHHSDEAENYWPGYVDALTSMVQVLAFVMMLLSMAVFVLSQNAAKYAIEAIAKAEKVGVPKKATVAELTEAIIEKIRDRNEQEGVKDKTPEATRPALPQPVSPSPAQIERPVATPGAATGPSPLATNERLAVRFQNRSYELEPKEVAHVGRFLEERQIVKKGVSLGVRAYAYSGAGELTEERRVAYYRALVVRSALIERKTAPGKLRINVFDTADKEQGGTVDIFVIDPSAE